MKEKGEKAVFMRKNGPIIHKTKISHNSEKKIPFFRDISGIVSK